MTFINEFKMFNETVETNYTHRDTHISKSVWYPMYILVFVAAPSTLHVCLRKQKNVQH